MVFFYNINKCGFNPIEKLNIQKEKIINILSNHVTLEEIGEFQGDFENIKMKLNSFENKCFFILF